MRIGAAAVDGVANESATVDEPTAEAHGVVSDHKGVAADEGLGSYIGGKTVHPRINLESDSLVGTTRIVVTRPMITAVCEAAIAEAVSTGLAGAAAYAVKFEGSNLMILL